MMTFSFGAGGPVLVLTLVRVCAEAEHQCSPVGQGTEEQESVLLTVPGLARATAKRKYL